jgi:hypothetical protein
LEQIKEVDFTTSSGLASGDHYCAISNVKFTK